MVTKSQSLSSKKASSTGVRNMVTRSNVMLLLMISVVIVSLVSMVLYLTDEGFLELVNNLSDSVEALEDTTEKVKLVFFTLSPILLFSCVALMLLVRLLMPNNKMMNIMVDLLLLVMSCLCGGFTFDTLLTKVPKVDGRGNISEIIFLDAFAEKERTIMKLGMANILLCLVFSVIQFLNILRP